MYDTGSPATPDVRTVAPRDERPKQRGIRRASVGTGTTSLLMIFTVLCFATLAMLSLSTATNNQKIQQRNTQNGIDLAAAKGQASTALAQLDGQLLALDAEWAAAEAGRGSDAPPFDGYYQLDAMSAAEKLGWTLVDKVPGRNDPLQLELVLTMNETTELVTRIEVLPPGGSARYQVTGQSTRLTAGWEPEPGPGVWGGVE